MAITKCYIFILISIAIGLNVTEAGSEFVDRNALNELLGERNLLTDSDHITVSVRSKYCSSNLLIGHSCDFQGTNKTIILDDSLSNDYSSTFMETTIYNATNLLISPVCLPWIQVFNAKHVKTVPGKNGNCGSWLRLYNSVASDVSIGVRDLSILNSTVDRVYLDNQRDILCYNSTIKDLEFLEWKGYYGYFDGCSVNKVTSLRINDDFTVERSHIGSFERSSVKFAADDFSFSNSEVEHWSTLGWSIENGKVHVENVTVQNSEPYAIRISSTAQLVLCRNVTFVNAKKPLFSVTPHSYLLLYNVTANGEDVTFHSDWVTFEPWRGNVSTVYIDEDLHGCHVKEDNHLVCRMKNCKKRIILASNQTYDTVSIYDANILEIEAVEIKNLSIFNSSIIFFGDVTPACNQTGTATLSIVKSTLNTDVPSAFTHVTIESSYVGKLTVSCTEKLTINATKIKLFQMEHSTTKLKVSSSMIEGFINSNVYAPIELDRVEIILMKNVTLDHPNEVSKFGNCSVSIIMYKGLILAGGNLTMHASIFHTTKESIYLDEGTSLSYDGPEVAFPKNVQFISVKTQDQVILSAQASITHLFIRTFEGTSDTPDEYFHLTGNMTSQLCQKQTLNDIATMVCNFSSIGKGVVVSLENSSLPWIFTSASKLFLNTFCAPEIKVVNITTGGSIQLYNMKCQVKLTVESSNLDTVIQYQGFLDVNKSNIAFLDFQNEWLQVHDSKIELLEAVAHKTVIHSTNITSVSLQATHSFIFYRSRMEILKRLVLEGEVSGDFGDTIITEFDQNSLYLDPMSLIRFIIVNVTNVPSNTFANNAGRFTMSHVHFSNSTLEGFRQFKRCILVCTDVTVNRINFNCSNLDSPLKYITTEKPMIQTTAPSPKLTSEPFWIMESNQTILEPIREHNWTENVVYPSLESSPSPSVGFTAAIIGFFIGIVVSVSALIIMMGSRPTRVSVLKLLKWNQDEGIELLPS